MKQIIFIIGVLFFVSCNREVTTTSPVTVEGDYTDTTSYVHPSGPPVAYPDTVIKKTVYKINDSTYWMVPFNCNDSSFASCGIYSHSYKLGFIIRYDNSINVLPMLGDPIFYLFPGSYYDPVTHYIYLTRAYSLNSRFETHRMRKL